jgi:hypothetical protein
MLGGKMLAPRLVLMREAAADAAGLVLVVFRDVALEDVFALIVAHRDTCTAGIDAEKLYVGPWLAAEPCATASRTVRRHGTDLYTVDGDAEGTGRIEIAGPHFQPAFALTDPHIRFALGIRVGASAKALFGGCERLAGRERQRECERRKSEASHEQ